MAQLIRHRAVTTDTWRSLDEGALPAQGDVIVPLAVWLSERARLLTRDGRVGVLLQPNDEPQLIAADLARLGVIAIHFASFTDGRGYSTARLLRQRYGWRGELRAVGDVQRDQLFYLARVGFDAFVLDDDADAHGALAAFRDFTEAYQSSVDRPVPLFRRRDRQEQTTWG
jgi:uncharacterized protein (DUF934 family)